VLTFETDSDLEARHAATLVAAFIRVDSETPTAAPDGHSGTAQVNDRHEAAPGALQFCARNANHYFGSRDSSDTSTGSMPQREPALPPDKSMETPFDASGAPAVPAAPFTNDDAARTGYRFGRDMHNNDRYRNRSWRDADADLKVLWNAHRPESTDWESSQSAVHLGWNSTSPEIDDDSYYRSHWRSGYAHHPMDGSAQPPASVPAAKAPDESGTAWKQRHPGQLPPWERFIDAVRHGWGKTTTDMALDEDDYRHHHAQHYPGTDYNDLAPVYRYGHNVHNRAAFRGRCWEEVEGELRDEWERGCREGKPSTWDEMKAALRQGWKHGES
jgi:hypothetical protein